MIGTINKTTEILKKYNIKIKKNFGQNFLIDPNIIKKIVETANIDQNTCVIEIGPGLGSLTEVLAQRAHSVLCYEIDQDMVDVIQNEVKQTNIKILKKDFLKANFEEDINIFPKDKRIIVVSNLPYYLTSPIIFKLLDSFIEEIYIMVQKEFGQRLASLPNCKDYGSITVITNLIADCFLKFSIAPNCFIPRPNVESVFLFLQKKKSDCGLYNEPKFKEFVHNIFAMRRKTLVNNLSAKYPFKKEEIEEELKKINFSPQVRSEVLSLEQIKLIYNIINNLGI